MKHCRGQAKEEAEAIETAVLALWVALVRSTEDQSCAQVILAIMEAEGVITGITTSKSEAAITAGSLAVTAAATAVAIAVAIAVGTAAAAVVETAAGTAAASLAIAASAASGGGRVHVRFGKPTGASFGAQ